MPEKVETTNMALTPVDAGAVISLIGVLFEKRLFPSSMSSSRRNRKQSRYSSLERRVPSHGAVPPIGFMSADIIPICVLSNSLAIFCWSADKDL